MVNRPMNRQPYYPNNNPPSSSSPLPIAIGILLVCSLALVIWYFFLRGSDEDTNQPIPLIKAEAGEFKTRPDNASQPAVPHQDKQIYSRVNPAEKQAKVENLLPEAEEPVEIDTLAMEESNPEAAPVATGYNEFKNDDYEPKIMTPPKSHDSFPAASEVAEVKAPQVTTVSQAPQQEKAQEDKIEKLEPVESKPVEAKPVSKELPEEKTVKNKKLKSGFRIQLASMKSPELAKKEWNRLKSDHKTVLGQLSPHYARVDLGASKGIFYRLQVGDFSDRATADKVCKDMKSHNGNVGCFVVPF